QTKVTMVTMCGAGAAYDVLWRPWTPSSQSGNSNLVAEFTLKGAQPIRVQAKSYDTLDNYFFPMSQCRWYFGPMNRFDAVALLQNIDNPNGTFLLRRSDHDSAGYVLSVRHFKVHQDKDKSFYIDTSTCFSSLRQLVAHYRKYTLAKTETLLGQPCPKPEFSDSAAQTHELPKEEFVLEEKLGGGPSSEVFRGTWKGQIRVAIKTFKDPNLTKQVFLNEVQPLKGLQHCHLVSLLAVCTESPPYYIVTELMEKGSLLLFLRGPEGQHQDIVSLMDIAAQVADGMSYLEKKDIVETLSNSACRWSAPETISHGTFTSKSDVWSFGVLLYEIITFGGMPYKDLRDCDVYDRISEGYRMPCPPRCPAFLYRMMLSCWSAKAEDRPSFSALLKELDNISCE
uniref:Tyrosine-protein kinase n=1 Tax=Neogobius melanostomus TaxID=47308 RepID=A0A8C6TQL3_9GOBI